MTAPFLVSSAVPGGTENAPTIAGEIASLGAQGGTILFPPGIYQCTNLSVPSNITLRGSHSTRSGVSTRLQALAGSGLPVLSIKGVSGNHLQNVMCEDLSLYGEGHAPIVDTAYTSYLRFYRCHIGNSFAPGLQLLENWDSRVVDCDFEYCGTTDGLAGAINCLPGVSDFTNSLVVENCRFEAFFGSAIKAAGNTNKLFLSNNKMESASSRVPFLDLNGCVHIGFDNQQLTVSGAAGTIPSFVSIVNCYGVFGHLSFESARSAVIPSNYMTLTNSKCIDLQLLTLSPLEPSAGAIVKWDGLNSSTTQISYQGVLTSPVCPVAAPPPPLPPLKPVSNQVSTRYFTVTNSSANRQNNRIKRCMTTNLTSIGLVLRYTGTFFSAGGGGDLTQNTATKTVEQVWIEYPTGVMTQGTVVGSGATSFTLDKTLGSYVDVYFPIKPNKGEVFVEQNSVQITGTNLFEAPNSLLPGDYGTYSLISGGSSKSQYPAGDPNAIAGSSGGGQAWGASVVLGYSDSPAFLLGSGDSILDGSGGDQTVGKVENPGSLARFLKNNYGYYKLSCPSSTIVAGTNALNITNLVNGSCKYALIEQGINPILSGASLALIKYQYKNLIKNERQGGAVFVIGSTLLPNAASTDSWNSYAAQTYTGSTSAAKEAVRQGFNSWLTSTKADGTLDAVFDLATITTDSANPNLWPTPAFMALTGGDGGTATYDGTHPTTTFNNWSYLIGNATFDSIISTLEASNANPRGLGTTLKTSYPQPTKKTAQFTMTNTSYPYWQYFGAFPLSLTDQSTGGPSGWTVSQSGSGWFSSSSGNTTYDAGNYHKFPDAVIGTFYRIQSIPTVLTISGLDPAKTYDLDILSGAGGASQNTQLTVSGATAGTPVTVVSGSTVNGVVLGNVDPTHWSLSPDAGGNITISIVRAAGQSYGVFNALSIQEN